MDKPLNAVSGKILYHVSIPVTVPRLTLLIEKFMIRCCQVTIFSARRAWLPQRFAYFAISVFRQVRKDATLS